MQGVDLSRHLRTKGPVTIEDAIDYIVQACLALAEAHAHGIIHRDVKPANLFMLQGAEGVAIKVLDFGISKVAEQTSLEVTKTTAILGSGLYMSPEQMKSSKTVDHRTDVYALGITLFELLTGTQPFTAESFAELNSGKIYNNRYHFLIELEDGKVRSVKEYSDTHHMLETFSA
jgi:serine/threonine-protein kinase